MELIDTVLGELGHKLGRVQLRALERSYGKRYNPWEVTSYDRSNTRQHLSLLLCELRLRGVSISSLLHTSSSSYTYITHTQTYKQRN
jgi:hypothetical protein